MANYIYIGKLFHHRLPDFEIPDKKIGKTSNLETREKSLNSTKMPVGYFITNAWETDDDTNTIEGQIHALLNHNQSRGEWFIDEKNDLIERVANFMERGGYKKVDLENDDDPIVHQAQENEKARQEKNAVRDKYFIQLIGETFSHKPSKEKVSIKVLSVKEFYCEETKITYTKSFNDSFTQATRELTDNPSYQGTNVWTIPKNKEGKSPDDIIEEAIQQEESGT